MPTCSLRIAYGATAALPLAVPGTLAVDRCFCQLSTRVLKLRHRPLLINPRGNFHLISVGHAWLHRPHKVSAFEGGYENRGVVLHGSKIGLKLVQQGVKESGWISRPGRCGDGQNLTR